MKKNKLNGLLVVAVLATVLAVGVYMVLQKTYFAPSASKSRSDFRSNNRSIKSEAVLITTPAIDTKANLSAALKELDGENPDQVVSELSGNEADSKDF